MKLTHIALSAALGLMASDSKALNLETCKSKLFKQLELVEKTGHSRVLARPKGRLKQFTEKFEILCPWQVEADFNGDKQKDWIGIAQIEGKYELLAYLSGPKKHYPRVIKRYKDFPSKIYLMTSAYKFAFHRSKGKIASIFPAQFTLYESNMDGITNVYGWDDTKKELKEIFQFVDKRNTGQIKE